MPHPCCLWDADGKYDFTQWENLAPDMYPHDGGDTDQDGIDESHLPGKQATEITSEFDYYGYYENMEGKDGIAIPCIKHYFEYRFLRKPGPCLAQFGPSTSQYVATAALPDLTVDHPVGVHPAQPFDLSQGIVAWAIRGDTARWDPRWVYYLKKNGDWEIRKTHEMTTRSVLGPDAPYRPLVIVSDSDNPDKGPALGQYWPHSPVNDCPVVGRRNDGTQVYTDPRLTRVLATDNPRRIPTMWRFGFLFDFRGLLNRNETPPGVYETFRTEVYLLLGTPSQIRDAAERIAPWPEKREHPMH